MWWAVSRFDLSVIRIQRRNNRRYRFGGYPHAAIHYVIDLTAGEEIPRKGGPGIAKSDPRKPAKN